MSRRKIPLAASLNGMPEGKGSRKKLIRVTGIPGVPTLELSGRRKLNLEVPKTAMRKQEKSGCSSKKA